MVGIDSNFPLKLCDGLIKLLLCCIGNGQKVVSIREIRVHLKKTLISLYRFCILTVLKIDTPEERVGHIKIRIDLQRLPPHDNCFIQISHFLKNDTEAVVCPGIFWIDIDTFLSGFKGFIILSRFYICKTKVNIGPRFMRRFFHTIFPEVYRVVPKSIP